MFSKMWFPLICIQENVASCLLEVNATCRRETEKSLMLAYPSACRLCRLCNENYCKHDDGQEVTSTVVI